MTNFLVGLTCAIFLAHVLWWMNWGKRDATDTSTARSGMIIYKDHGTGIQYLGTVFGGLTPRLGPDGKPMVD